MNVRLIEGPSEPPVTFQQLVDHIKPADAEAEQQDLQLKLAVAIAFVQNELNRPLVTSTLESDFGRWPHDRGYFELSANTQSVESFTYRDSRGEVHEFTRYREERLYSTSSGCSDAGKGRVYPVDGESWPMADLGNGDPITIRYTAGWLDADSVPTPIKAAILLYAGHLYRNREAVTVGGRAALGGGATPMISTPLAMAVDSLLARYRVY